MTPIQTKIARRREHLILAEGFAIEIAERKVINPIRTTVKR